MLAGDVVPRKKPAPDIYQLAVRELGADPAEALVVEDSRNGLVAAAAPGLRCVITVNGYTADEDFTEAVLVVARSATPRRAGRGCSPTAAARRRLGDARDLEACLEGCTAGTERRLRDGQAGFDEVE